MKNFWLIISLLFSGLLLTGCNKTVVENCWDDCINESDIDVLEHRCMEYVNKALFDNIEETPNPTAQYFYDNSWSMEYTFTDAEFSWTYYWIKWYVKAWDKSQNFICNIYTGWWLHDLYFYNDKSNNEEPEFTWYYFIAETPTSNPVSTSFSISDPWNTPLRTWMVLNMPITGFNNWDIVKVYYWRDYEELEKFTDFHTPRRASKPYKTEIIWSLKDELFIPRDNSQYKLQTENIEEPIVKTRKWVCRLYDESFNETIYEYTYPDLWIRITTPECWDTTHLYDKSDGVLFRSWSTILSTNKWSADWFYEYLTPYTKDPNQSLEEIIKERHLNPWCELNPWTPIAFKDVEWTWYFVTAPNGWSSEEPTRCYSDDEDDNIKRWVLNIWYFEPANDKSRYYKLRLLDGCAPWPCTIFGKVETL